MPNIWPVIRNTVLIAFSKMVGGVVVPVTFALLLNEITNITSKRMFQTLVYLPNFLSWVIMAGIFIDILSPSQGLVNTLLGKVGVEPLFFLGNPSLFPATMVITDIWKGFGFGTIIIGSASPGSIRRGSGVDGGPRAIARQQTAIHHAARFMGSSLDEWLSFAKHSQRRFRSDATNVQPGSS